MKAALIIVALVTVAAFAKGTLTHGQAQVQAHHDRIEAALDAAK